VRQHWEKDGPASAPGRSGRTNAAVPSYAPFRGWQTRPPAAHGCAPWATLFRPSGSAHALLFAACRYAGQLAKLPHKPSSRCVSPIR